MTPMHPSPDAAGPAASSASSARGDWRRLLASPEAVALLLLVAGITGGGLLSPKYFLDFHYLMDSTSLYMEAAIMALAMTFVIISGNIDLSVAANLALTAVLCGELHLRFGVPMGLVIVAGPCIGAVLGLFNGLLIARLRLPSLTVTIGTLALYRGLAQVMIGDAALQGFPDWFNGIDQRYVAGLLPLPLVIFLVLAVACALVLHRSLLGRFLYAMGTNESAARYSGVRAGVVKVAVFAIAGGFSGLGAVMMTSRLGTVQYSLADGQELAVITAVVLGGTDIFGGRGTIFGTVVATFLLGIISRAMGLALWPAENQLAVSGSLLIFAVVLYRLLAKIGTTIRT